MTILFDERLSDSPYVDKVMRGYTISQGAPTRPAEMKWHMVLTKHDGINQFIVVGPWTSSGVVTYGQDAEILWIQFKLGTFMPHLPMRAIIDKETALPEARSNTFWLKSSAWQFPDYDNADTFIDRLVREEILVNDPVVTAALQGHPQDVAPRTVRHRFLRATGLSQNQVFQHERAQQAAALLQQGVPILDTVYEAGYFDQPHLTRSLKQYIGFTPAQIQKATQSDVAVSHAP